MVRPHGALVLAAIACSWLVPAGAGAATVEEEVTATLAGFKQALSARDGVAAAAFIDDRTAAFYDKVRRAALGMPEKRLLRQPLFFQMAVLSTRLRFTKADLEQADGNDVCARLAAGEAGAHPFGALTLVRIQPTRAGASAVTHVSVGDRAGSVGLRIFSQGGAWKIDLTRLFEAENAELQRQTGITSKTPSAAVKRTIEKDLFPIIARQAGRPVADSVWLPLANAK